MFNKFIKKFQYLFFCNFSSEPVNYNQEILYKTIETNYVNNNLKPIDVNLDNKNKTIIYENKESIEIYKQYAWYGNFIYSNILKNTTWNYVMFFKNQPADNISKLIINTSVSLEALYFYNPIMVSENNEKESSIMTFVYMLKNEDIIFLTVNKTFVVITDAKTKKSTKKYDYFIENIEIKNKKDILDTLKYINNYSIGSQISSNILKKIENISLIVPIPNSKKKHYCIYFSLPHNYSECRIPHKLEDSKNILYILVINEDNIIENIIYKPYCCLG
jgi:hypothetical protein